MYRPIVWLLAVGMTLSLVWVMKGLIETRSVEDEFPVPPARILYVSNDDMEINNPLPPAPAQEQQPEEAPEQQQPQALPPPVEKADAVAMPQQEPKPEPVRQKPKAQPARDQHKPAVAASPAAARAKFDTTPIYRPKPAYPMAARRQHIEGYVLVGYSVLKNGSVGQVRVISSSPAGIFDAVALEAVRSWRFNPQPGDHGGMQSRIRFQLR